MRYADAALIGDLKTRVEQLEAVIIDLQEKLAYKPVPLDAASASSDTAPADQTSASPKKCPKCGVESPRGLHVKFCRGGNG